METIGGNIFVETEYLGCNPSFVVTGEGVVMVDAPGMNLSQTMEWREKIAARGQVSFLINTDHHSDHLFGDFFFGGQVIMNEGTWKRTLDPQLLKDQLDFIHCLNPSAAELLTGYHFPIPRFTFSDKMTLHLGKEIFELTHIHGHTPDETLVYMPERKILFAGDNVCTMGIPNLAESWPREWLRALADLETWDIDVLVPGHGPVGDKESVKTFHRDFRVLNERVQEMIARGLTRGEVGERPGYEDRVHQRYPSHVAERFRHKRRLSMERLYDVWSKSPAPPQPVSRKGEKA